MNIILLSGGSGKRLWPLSNEVRSKQFLKIFKLSNGSRESMIQRMYRMICTADSQADVTIATSENQVSSIRAQLGDGVGISVEPCRRDTFPAIVLAVSYLHDARGFDENEPVVVCPVDPYVEADYFEMLKELSMQAAKDEANLILMGIKPTYPSEKYGYIIPESSDEISNVISFKEKPNIDVAESYLAMNALWNGGIFAFKLGYILDIAKKTLGSSEYKYLFSHYYELSKISFDYAVTEKEKKIQVMKYTGQWKDLGTWNTLTEAMSDGVSGKAIAVECENTHIINELQLPLIALGVKNAVIAATPDGILVTDKFASGKLKEYVPDNRPMYEKRVWGEYKVLDYRIQSDGNNSLVKHLIIDPEKHISYQRHKHRSEMWTVVEGDGCLILEGEARYVTRGDTAFITPGLKHAIKAISTLHIIEVQIGNELSEQDIERLDFDWDRC